MTARSKLRRGLLTVPWLLGVLAAGVAAGPLSSAPAAAGALAGGDRLASTVGSTTPQWQPYPSAAPAPPARQAAAMAYDAASNQVVLFGGVSANGTVLGDTWVWTGSGWHEEAPAASPPPLEGASMAYDSTLAELILFGGVGAGHPGTPVNTTWAWNGASWYALDGSGSPLPPARSGAVLASDGGAFVLFGGTGAGGNVLDDTWSFNGAAWTADSPPASPPPLTGAASTWDAAHRQVVVFGGQSSAPSSTWSAGTWSWSGTTWIQVAPPGPSARTGATLAYDGDVAGDVLVGGTGAGGTDSDAWLFNGSGWTGLTALNPPPARYLATSAWDSAAHQLILFGGAGAGGTVLGDTEVLSVPAAAPPPTSTTTTRPASRPAAPSTAPPSARPKTSSPTTVSESRRSPPSTALRRRAPNAVAARIKPRAVAATLRTTARRVKRGQTVKLMGSGFAPGALVSLSLHSQPVALGTTHADARGRFEVRVLVPTDVALGAHHLEASGRLASGADRTLSTAVDVVALGSGRPLWETLSMVALALLIPVVTWIVMDVRSKRRRARAPAPSG